MDSTGSGVTVVNSVRNTGIHERREISLLAERLQGVLRSVSTQRNKPLHNMQPAGSEISLICTPLSTDLTYEIERSSLNKLGKIQIYINFETDKSRLNELQVH
jgi:hypothetical protein